MSSVRNLESSPTMGAHHHRHFLLSLKIWGATNAIHTAILPECIASKLAKLRVHLQNLFRCSSVVIKPTSLGFRIKYSTARGPSRPLMTLKRSNMTSFQLESGIHPQH